MTINNERIEVVTSVQRRRRWSLEEKHTIIRETYQPGMSVSYIARKYGITPSQLFLWRRLMEAGALKGEKAPHKALKMLSPREYLRVQKRACCMLMVRFYGGNSMCSGSVFIYGSIIS